MKGWQIRQLSEIAEYFIGLTYAPKNVTSHGTIVLRSTNIQNDQLDLSELVRVSIPIKPHLKVQTGDILMCSRNGSKHLVGKSATIGELQEEMTFGTFMTVIRSELSPYLAWFFKSDEFRNQLVAGQATRINQITKYMLDAIRVPVPPLPEQRRIVGILDEAFEGIATAKATAEKNLQNARALFESHLNAIAAEKVPLGELVNIKTGKLDANAAVEGGEYPFFTCSRETYAIDNYAFDCEAILLAGNNAVGDFNVKHYKGKFNAYQRTYVITVNEKRRVLYRFLYFQMLKSLAKFKSQSVGAGTKFLKLGMIKDMEIPLPTLAEQKQIVATMDSIRQGTERLESMYKRKLAVLDELKKSLLHQAFSGQL